MDDFESLEFLSLVSRVSTELQNHLSISDKTLAEFVIAQHEKAETLDEFKAQLDAMGADFSQSLLESIDRLILTMHPKHKAKKTKVASNQSVTDERQRKSRIFKGLSMPDSAIPGRASLDDGSNDKKAAQPLDDTFAMLEGLATNSKPNTNGHKREDGHAPRKNQSPSDSYENGSRQRRHDSYSERYMNGHRPHRHDSSYDRFENGYRSRKQEIPTDMYDRGGRKRRRNSSSHRRPRLVEEEKEFIKAPQKKRLTSPERWEIKQLIASGVLSAQDYPDLDDYNATVNGEEPEEEVDVDIEVREEEPPFLAGQTKQSLELSPIRVVKAPDGSMNRAALQQSSLAKERRELREQEAKDKAAEEASRVDLSAQWQDPMVSQEQRKFASDLRRPQAHKAPGTVPEWKQAIQGKNQSLGKRTDLSMKEQREGLPVFKFRKQLIEAVANNQLLVVVGDTGSGKTTQLTQYLAEAGYANEGLKIGCTQPRRVAAMSVAKRVAEETGCRLGEEVGYTIRFEDNTSDNTIIKYMTDGMLQREVLLDPLLRKYSVIMLDEAHERTISTDVLFALLKKTIKKRSDLKVIVTSATLDADKFSEYFNKCPIFTIPGRTYPVEIMYSREPESDYLDAALQTTLQIHLSEPAGDILLFLTGQEEIDTSCEILFERMKALGPKVPELVILPIYSALPTEIQSKVFEPAPSGGRKVVIATNIAETSLTIDGIYYVIDPGFVKQNAYDPKLGMDSLVVTPISQAQAKQRAGRAGRTGPGKCFRLYTEAAFQSEMIPTTIPEIQRQNLSHTILMLKAMGINDLLHFDFMDPPPTNTMLTALEELYALSALDDEGLLTRLGRKMADFPMEPALAKVLIYSVEHGCSDEMLSIVAMLSVQTVFYRPKEKQQQADQKKAKFHDPTGDHLTLLNVYARWKDSRFSSPWCYENFIQFRSMKRAQDVRNQLVGIMDRYKHQVVSCGRNTNKIRQALCSGFFKNAARKDPSEGYKTLVEGNSVSLHPSSALFGKSAEHVIFHTLVMTTKEYMQCTTSIEPKWLVDAAPTFFKVAPTDKLSKRRKAERIQPLYNRFAGEDDWRLSAQKRQGRGGGGGTWG